MPSNLRPGILLDRDGTIIEDTGYPGRPEQVKLLPGAAEAIRSFNEAGIPVAVVTNQGGVAFGYHTIEDVLNTHDHIADVLSGYGAHVDLFLFCPYHPKGTDRAFARHSEDRKPQPGMAIAAQKALDLDLRRSWVVGDRSEDMGLAQEIGARAAYIGTSELMEGSRIYRAADLAAAAPPILELIAR